MVRFSKSVHAPFKLLYVDDESLSLKYFQQIVGDEHEVLTAASAEEALKIVELEHESIGVVVSDQKLGGMQGSAFLTLMRERHPEIVRILATGFSDLTAVIAAINEGAIFHYIQKPWEPDKLLGTLQRAADQYLLRAERDRLLNEKSGMVRDLLVSDRMAGYGVLADGINHHLRNALVPVEAFLQISAQEPGAVLGGAIQANDELLGQLRVTATTQVRHIIDLLSRLSSVRSLKLVSADDEVFVDRLWQEVVGQISDNIFAKGVEINVSCDAALPSARSSRDRLAQVFRLVIEDALERLPPGGQIHVSVGHGAAAGGHDEHIRVEISDSGSALDESQLRSIFTPFSLRRDTPQYVGLNLPTAYMTLCGIGGWAGAFNDHDRGTVISLGIPLRALGGSTRRLPPEVIELVLGGRAEETALGR